MEDREFEIGDKVRVIDNGLVYTTYNEWFKRRQSPNFERYKYGMSVKEDVIGTIIEIDNHGYFDKILCAVEIEEEKNRVILIETFGLELVDINCES